MGAKVIDGILTLKEATRFLTTCRFSRLCAEDAWSEIAVAGRSLTRREQPAFLRRVIVLVACPGGQFRSLGWAAKS